MNFPYRSLRITNPAPYLSGGTHDSFPLIDIDTSAIGSFLQTVRVKVLVDTGASATVFPNSIAVGLGLDLTQLPSGQFQTAGGLAMQAQFTDVTLMLTDGLELFQWDTTVGFLNQPMPWGLLGRSGFLQFFDVTFYGERKEMNITPNASFQGIHIVP